ncbi:hypothetical protein TcasGA2_TC002798 [Tribolium castaneum]|uniref:Uncharacterized protein n=1 Tax=Tribolium castaneum TaxID=7070 RepID=D6WIL7_TRICA|nr:hypothetical protein TcasGA2_TC002798 [Tribolium castaneum]
MEFNFVLPLASCQKRPADRTVPFKSFVYLAVLPRGRKSVLLAEQVPGRSIVRSWLCGNRQLQQWYIAHLVGKYSVPRLGSKLYHDCGILRRIPVAAPCGRKEVPPTASPFALK